MRSYRCVLTRTLAVVGLAAGLTTNIHGQVAVPVTCNSTISNVSSWLQQNGDNWVSAVIASNKPGYYAFGASVHPVVTYSSIPLKRGTGLSTGYLLTLQKGKQYFSNKFWGWPPPPGEFGVAEFPFSPNATKNISITISPSGKVTITPDGVASHTFIATCQGGVMFGTPAPPPNVLGPRPPMYTITFAQGTTPVPK